MLPGSTMLSITLIQFAAAPVGTHYPGVRRGVFEGSVADAGSVPVFGPWGESHELEMTKPPRKFMRTSGHLIRDLSSFSELIPALF